MIENILLILIGLGAQALIFLIGGWWADELDRRNGWK